MKTMSSFLVLLTFFCSFAFGNYFLNAAENGAKDDSKVISDLDWEPDWDTKPTEKKESPLPKTNSDKKTVSAKALANTDNSKTGSVDKKTDNKTQSMPVVDSKKSAPAVDSKKSTPVVDSKKSKPTVAPAKARCSIAEILPGNAIATIWISSMKELNAQAKSILTKLGFGNFAPLEWLKYTPYRNAVDNLDLDAPIAISFLEANGEYGHVIAFPVKNYTSFATAFGVTNATSFSETPSNQLPVKFCRDTKRPNGYIIYGTCGYAMLFSDNLRSIFNDFYSWGTLASSRRSRQSTLINPLLSLEIYSRGVQQIARLKKSGLKGFSLDINTWIESLEDPKLKANVDKFSPDLAKRWNDLLNRTEKNLRYFRFDLASRDNAFFGSVTCIPDDGTPLMTQIEDQPTSDTPLTLEYNKLLKYVPTGYSTPICGQIDLPASAASTLESPFNRIRHLEYSLIMPDANKFLAENWCLFLEVEDADSFVRELVVPKAQFIGGYQGSEMLGDLGSRVFGNIAVRRGRRSPEEAAQRGGTLGARLGEQIGQVIGEREATAKYNFDGFPMYIADMEFYTRKMAEINAKQSGEIPTKPLNLTGEYTLLNMFLETLDGRQNGIGNLLGGGYKQFSSTDENKRIPNLIARKNYFLILDEKHIIIAPGNRDLLRETKNNWVAAKDGKARPIDTTATPQKWIELWNSINSEIRNGELQQIRTINKLDPVSIKSLAGYLNTYYLQNAPLKLEGIPNSTPELILFTSTGKNSLNVYIAAPTDTVFAFIELLKKK